MKEKKKSGLGKVAVGAAIGVGLGVLFAPKSGKETRNDIKEKVKTLTSKEYQDEFKRKVRMNRDILTSIKMGIKSLNFFKYGWFSYFYFYSFLGIFFFPV